MVAIARPQTGTRIRRARGSLTGWLWPAVCCAAVLCAILLANPFNESGFDDDWSYGRVAMKLAQTGTLRYNGWGSPLVLFQVLWAVPWIQAFGFSFQVLEASTIPVSLGFVLLIYATARAAGLTREFASFAAIGTGTCPLFLPLAASFMTEAYGCFFGMACIYCSIRAARPEERHGPRWLWALMLAGLAGGANRQIVWAAPLALIPYVAWERGKERVFRIQTAAAYGGLVLGIAVVMHYFSQPYPALQIGGDVLKELLANQSGRALIDILRLLCLCVLLSVPAFFCFLPRFAWRSAVPLLICALGIGVLTIAGLLLGWPAAPYGNNLITVSGVAIGPQDPIDVVVGLPPALRLLLTAIVNVCIFFVAQAGVLSVGRRQYRMPQDARIALCVLGLFAISYLPLIFPGALLNFLYDRYMLPLVPVAFIAILLAPARRPKRLPTAAWACLLVFCGYAIATTHDYAAGLRARLEAVRSLEQEGISRNRISASFESDGWTQLERTDHARGSSYADHFSRDEPKGFWFEYWDHFADLNPDFVVLNGARPTLPRYKAAFGFRAWLPPFQRSVVVWKRAELTAELQLARIVSTRRRP